MNILENYGELYKHVIDFFKKKNPENFIRSVRGGGGVTGTVSHQ